MFKALKRAMVVVGAICLSFLPLLYLSLPPPSLPKEKKKEREKRKKKEKKGRGGEE